MASRRVFSPLWPKASSVRHRDPDIASVFGKDERYFAEFRLLRALLDEGGASSLEGALSIAREIEPALKAPVVDVDPRQYPHAMPIGCGLQMRRQRARAAA